jgi:hypothetical protein
MNVRKAVAEYLSTQKMGATRSQIMKATGASSGAVFSALQVMPHVYIDRWAAAKAGPHRFQWVPVWAMVDLPPHAEKPTRQPTEYDYQQELL